MDSVAVGVVAFGVSSGGDPVGVGDEESAEGGLGVVGEVVPGENGGGGVARTSREKAGS